MCGRSVFALCVGVCVRKYVMLVAGLAWLICLTIYFPAGRIRKEAAARQTPSPPLPFALLRFLHALSLSRCVLVLCLLSLITSFSQT